MSEEEKLMEKRNQFKEHLITAAFEGARKLDLHVSDITVVATMLATASLKLELDHTEGEPAKANLVNWFMKNVMDLLTETGCVAGIEMGVMEQGEEKLMFKAGVEMPPTTPKAH